MNERIYVTIDLEAYWQWYLDTTGQHPKIEREDVCIMDPDSLWYFDNEWHVSITFGGVGSTYIPIRFLKPN